jgi:hypothetical protein
MNITFDFGQPLNEDQIKEMSEGQTGVIMTTMKNFVEQRLNVLREEIEENENYKIVIHFFNRQIRFYGVSEELSRKMIGSINQQDYEFLMNQIWSELYPGLTAPSN